MALHTCIAWASAVLGTVIATADPAAAQGTTTPSVPVTVYDAWMEPYTSYGRAQAGGAVIIFDQAPLGLGTQAPPSLDAALPGPVTVIEVPLEPPAGPASPERRDAPSD